MNHSFRLLALAVIACIPLLQTQPQENAEQDARMMRSAWLREAKWGTMTHFLSDWLVSNKPPWQNGEKLDASRVITGPMTPKRWNKLVECFDVETFADQLKSVNAGYHIMTVGQTSGYYLSPNKTFDRIIDRSVEDSWFPKRDLIKEIGDALHKRDIRFIVYIPIEEPRRGDMEASQILRPKDQKASDGHIISEEEAGRIFIKNWNQVLGEYAQRWGSTVDGWWFDGCWEGKLSYEDAPNWNTIIDTLRQGNPDAIVSFNHQYRNLRGLNPPPEDFFAGETNKPQSFLSMSPTREDGASSQMLTFLGYTWYYGNRPRFDEATAMQITRNVSRYGGAITWDIAIQPNGHLVDSYLPTLKAINKAAHEDIKGQWLETSGGKILPEGNIAYKKPAYFISNKINEGHHGLFTKLLDVNDGTHIPENGVDNDMKTLARAGGEWAWSYAIDLVETSAIKRINVVFGEKAFPTQYEVQLSEDGLNWKTVHTAKNTNGMPLKLKLRSAVHARWVRIKALKPDAEGQKGEQMSLRVVQVFT